MGAFNMQELINGFLETLKADGKSKCTLKAYSLDLKEFAKFFDGVEVSKIRYADLRSWSNHLEASGLSPSSRGRKIAAVRSFFHYLIMMEVIDKNPSDGLESPKQEKKAPVVITMEEAAELLRHARNDGGSEMFFFRDYAIMATFLFTGVRREELTNISLADVDLNRNTILIHGKGSKQRTVYINDTLHAVLSEYISNYRKRLTRAGASKYLFPSSKSDKISANTVNHVVNRFFESAGIKQAGISAHVLRKRFATSVFENTGDIALTSKLLGHSSPTVTMRYVAMNEDSMRAATNCVNF